MSRLGTQKSCSRLAKGCAFILEQCTETWSFWFEGVVLFRAECAGEKAMRHESKATRKVADSELNSPACGMNENRVVNAVKRRAHFPLFSQTSTSAEVTDSSFSGGQSPLIKGKVKGIIHRQGNTRKGMTGKARSGMWGWIFALVFLWNTHMLRAQGKFRVVYHNFTFYFTQGLKCYFDKHILLNPFKFQVDCNDVIECMYENLFE